VRDDAVLQDELFALGKVQHSSENSQVVVYCCARSRFSLRRSPIGACHNLCDCSAVSQFPNRTPIFFTLFDTANPCS
jgi:hypothetical protein